MPSHCRNLEIVIPALAAGISPRPAESHRAVRGEMAAAERGHDEPLPPSPRLPRVSRRVQQGAAMRSVAMTNHYRHTRACRGYLAASSREPRC